MIGYLQELFLGEHIKLMELDKEIVELLKCDDNIDPYFHDIREILEDGFIYTSDEDGEVVSYEFQFELVEDNENILDAIVRVESIEEHRQG